MSSRTGPANIRAVDPADEDPDDEPYPFIFRPLDLAETALQELLGFTFEGAPRPDDGDPFEIPSQV